MVTPVDNSVSPYDAGLIVSEEFVANSLVISGNASSGACYTYVMIASDECLEYNCIVDIWSPSLARNCAPDTRRQCLLNLCVSFPSGPTLHSSTFACSSTKRIVAIAPALEIDFPRLFGNSHASFVCSKSPSSNSSLIVFRCAVIGWYGHMGLQLGLRSHTHG